MPSLPLAKSAILMVAIVLATIFCWEIYLRQHGFDFSYFDDPALWSHNRDMVYEPADKATVFIGSSRIKFDLDIDLWQKITGDHAIQLACVGSTPIPVLENLAADENFKGRLIVDVTEGLFFSTEPGNSRRPNEGLKHFKDRTPAQNASFQINHLLESQLVFLDKEWLSLGAYLDKIPVSNRPGVFKFGGFPSDFGRVKFNRHEYMTDKFSADTALRNQVKNIWDGFRKASKSPPASGPKLDSILTQVKVAVDKIKARGGQVLFVRTPSSGSFLMGEGKGFTREKYWDRILSTTQCQGIHFADYPVLDHFDCPKNSHLSLSQAKVFTKEFIRILSEEKGWKFPQTASASN